MIGVPDVASDYLGLGQRLLKVIASPESRDRNSRSGRWPSSKRVQKTGSHSAGLLRQLPV